MQPTRHPGLGPSTTTTHHTSIGGGEKTTTSSGSVPKTSQNTRGIKLGGWSIQVTSGNIGSSAEMDALSDLLGIPPPEMAFPHNSLVLSHPQSGFHLCFDAVRALQSVYGVKAENKLEGVDCDRSDKPRRATKMGDKPTARGKAAIKVAYADEWGKKRNEAQAQQNSNEYTDNTDPSPAAAATSSSSSSSNFGPDVAMAAAASGIASAKEYDWTYSSTWAGALGQTAPPRLLPNDGTEEAQDTLATTTSSNEQSWFAPGTDPAQDRIPVERLGPSSGEPILFYDDIVLYEDELADNGSSMVNVKVRVMPSGFLVLQRFFLRVDDVLFRVFDTRLYCEFTQDTAPSSTPATGAGGPDLSTLSLGATRAATKRQATAQDEQQASKWPRLIRECSGSEATYAEVKACLPPYKPHDLSPLTDPNWVANSLQTISRRRYQAQAASLATGRTPHLSTAAHLNAPTSLSHLASARVTGFPGTRPGEHVDLSPARAPAPPGKEEAKILAELQEDQDKWEGIGARVDVAVLKY